MQTGDVAPSEATLTAKEDVTFSIDPNAPHRVASASDGRSFTYYPDGSLWTVLGPGPDWTYTYDLQGRLSQATESPSGMTT